MERKLFRDSMNKDFMILYEKEHLVFLRKIFLKAEKYFYSRYR